MAPFRVEFFLSFFTTVNNVNRRCCEHEQKYFSFLLPCNKVVSLDKALLLNLLKTAIGNRQEQENNATSFGLSDVAPIKKLFCLLDRPLLLFFFFFFFLKKGIFFFFFFFFFLSFEN